MRNPVWLYYEFETVLDLPIRLFIRELLKTCWRPYGLQAWMNWLMNTIFAKFYIEGWNLLQIVLSVCHCKNKMYSQNSLRITPPFLAKCFWSLYVDFVFLYHTFFVPFICLLWVNLGSSHFHHTVLPSSRRNAVLFVTGGASFQADLELLRHLQISDAFDIACF